MWRAADRTLLDRSIAENCAQYVKQRTTLSASRTVCAMHCRCRRVNVLASRLGFLFLAFAGSVDSAVDFRSLLAAEAGTSNDDVATGPVDVVSTHISCAGNVSLTETTQSATLAKRFGVENVTARTKIEGNRLVVDTLFVDEIVALGMLDIEGLLGMDDKTETQQKTTDQAAFLEVGGSSFSSSSFSSSRPSSFVLYDSDAAPPGGGSPDIAHGWQLLSPATSLRKPRALVQSSCGPYMNVLGGPCQGRTVEFQQTFPVPSHSSGEGSDADGHCHVCVEFQAHFIDEWRQPLGTDVVYASLDGNIFWLDSHASPARDALTYDLAPNVCGDQTRPDTKLGTKVRACLPHHAGTATLKFGGVFSSDGVVAGSVDDGTDACSQSWGVSGVVMTTVSC